MTRRSIVSPLAAFAATVAVGLPITAGHAQSGPRTITVTNGKGKIVFDDLAPRGMKRGKLSLGIASCRPSRCTSTASRPGR